MRTNIRIVSAVLVLAGIASWSAPALASPQAAPTASSVATFNCGQAGTYTGFANSGNSGALTWNPFFLTAADGSAAVLVPTANDLVVTVDSAVVFAPNAVKGNAVGAVACTVAGGSGPVVVSGSITGSLQISAPAR